MSEMSEERRQQLSDLALRFFHTQDLDQIRQTYAAAERMQPGEFAHFIQIFGKLCYHERAQKMAKLWRVK